jgi:two-component system, NarL family, response regulator LiaR
MRSYTHSPSRGSPEGAVGVSRVRILVADDSEDFRNSVSLLFQMEDRIEIVGRAANGQETVEAAAVLKPDVVLMDISIESPDPVSTAARLFRLRPSIEVVFMSNPDSWNKLIDISRACGAKYFIDKTQCVQELAAVLNRTASRLSV